MVTAFVRDDIAIVKQSGDILHGITIVGERTNEGTADHTLSATVATTEGVGEKNIPGTTSVDMLGMAGLVLTIVALAIAVWQFIEARRQTQSLQAQTDNLHEQTNNLKAQTHSLTVIANAMTTKYICAFPEYLIKVADLMRRAQKEILILCTVPMHGVFNYHAGWFETKQAIEKAIREGNGAGRIKPVCVFATSQQRIVLQRYQYGRHGGDWEEWKTKNNEKIQYIIDHFCDNVEVSNLNFDKFIELLETVAKKELDTTFRGAEIIEIDYSPPMYLWIIDQHEAVFVLKTVFPQFKAEAFWTTDTRLIESLVTIHSNYVHGSKSVPDSLMSGQHKSIG